MNAYVENLLFKITPNLILDTKILKKKFNLKIIFFVGNLWIDEHIILYVKHIKLIKWGGPTK